MNLEQLTRELEEFLAGSTDAVVWEDGAVTFDLHEARYSVSEQHGKVLLHLWSHERNVVRRVLEAERGKDSLQLSVLRFGQSHPVKLEIARNRDRRSTATKNTERAQYRSLLLRLLQREFPTHRIDQLISTADLERSFGPVHASGVMRKGNAWTVLGVGRRGTSATRRVHQVRIFSRARIVGRVSAPDLGCAGAACASGNRHAVAVSIAVNRVAVGGGG